MLVEKFHWSMRDLDESDMESVLRFVKHYPRWKENGKRTKPKALYADQIDWI